MQASPYSECVPQRYAVGTRITDDTGIMSGTTRSGQQLLIIVGIEQVTPPDKNRNTIRRPKAKATIDQGIPVDVQIFRR